MLSSPFPLPLTKPTISRLLLSLSLLPFLSLPISLSPSLALSLSISLPRSISHCLNISIYQYINISHLSTSPHIYISPLCPSRSGLYRGAIILTTDQVQGFKDDRIQDFGNEEENGADPPRLWQREANGEIYGPGVAFTRSIGDSLAERIGCIAQPELLKKEIEENDEYIVICSDGVFEFLSNQAVLDIVLKYDDLLAACKAVVQESYRLWLQYEIRTDDITCIAIKLRDFKLTQSGSGSQASMKRRSLSGKLASGITFGNEQMLKAKIRPVRRDMSRAKRAVILGGEGKSILNDATEEEEEYKEATDIPPKTEKEIEVLTQAVKANFLFQHLNEMQRTRVFNAMRKIMVKAGEFVIKQGDKGDRFYVVETGRYEVLISRDGGEPQSVCEFTAKLGLDRMNVPMNLLTKHPTHSSCPATRQMSMTRTRVWAQALASSRSCIPSRVQLLSAPSAMVHSGRWTVRPSARFS